LQDEGSGAQQGRRGREGQHVDAVDEFRGGAEVSRVVDFVLEEDACYFVGREAGRVDGIGVLEVEVRVEGAGLDCQHEVSCLC
jgi:hypothetical protein